MNTKSNSIMLSKELTFKREDKAFNNTKKIKKDSTFKDKIDSFSKKENKENIYQSKVDDQPEMDRSKKQDQDKTSKKNEEDHEFKAKNTKDLDKSIINQQDIEYQDPKIQSYLMSLLNNKIEVDQVPDQETGDLIEMDIDLKDLGLVLIEQVDDKESTDKLKEISPQFLTEEVDLKSGLESEKTDTNFEGKISLSEEDIKKTLTDDIRPLEKETKALEKALKKPTLTIGEDNKEAIKNAGPQETNKDEEVKVSDEATKNKESSQEFDPQTEELKVDKTKEEINDKGFQVDEKQEINTIKNPDQTIEKLESIDMEKNIQEIAEKMRFSINNQKNLIKINLKPKSLGELTMEIELVKNVLTAKIMVDNEKTKQLIQDNLYQLKDEIKDTALEIKSFEVFVGSGNDFSKHSRGQFNFNQFNKKNKNNENLKKALKKSESIDYMESPLAKDDSNQYLEGSLNLLA